MQSKTEQDSYDGPWKAILDDYLQDFLEVCFPEVAAAIDWTQPIESLEQEIAQLAPDGPTGQQHVDKLFRVHLRDGTKSLILIHIEVQSHYDAGFAERFFCYHVRIFDSYREPVISLAVLGDERPQWKPDHFGYAHCGCVLSFQFPCVKLIELDRGRLAQKQSVIAAFILAHLDTMETRKNPRKRLERRIAYYRRLLGQGFSSQQIRDLLRAVDWMMRLPPELSNEAYRAFRAIEEEYTVTYVTTFEQYGWAKGHAEGLAAGLKEGHAEGHAEGFMEGLRKAIGLSIALKFSQDGDLLIQHLAQVQNLTTLEQIHV